MEDGDTGPKALAESGETLPREVVPLRPPAEDAQPQPQPVTRQSGSSIRGQSRSRRGNHRLKNAMFLAAFASLRDAVSRAFDDRKRAEGKGHNAAMICLARRRRDVILAMRRSRHPYLAGPTRQDGGRVTVPRHP